MADLARLMRCVEISKPGPPEALRLTARPTPFPENDEILIQVAAAGVNRPDALQRAGAYPPPKDASDLPGLEVAGVVVDVGRDASEWRVGDLVTALVSGGGYAEYCVAHKDVALPAPASLSVEQSAALPETVFTVWANLFGRAGLSAGETVLIHGGSSGIGTTAIQLAMVFGARVFVTAGSAEKCAACEALGAEAAFNYREVDFVDAVRAATGGRGADVVLDMVGGDYLDRNIKAAAEDGRLVSIAFLQGGKPAANWSLAMRKRLTWTGSTLRPRSIAFKAGLAADIRERVWPLVEAGRVAPVMDMSFPLEGAAAAHARMEASAHIGKIVLTL